MTLAELIPLALKVSIGLIVFALGLKANLSDLTYVLSRPGQLLRSLLAMIVIMPLVAVLLVKAMPSLPHTAGVVLIALALSPVPPLVLKKQTKAGGHASYATGLLVAASLVAIVWIPLAVELLDPFFPASLRIDPMPVASGVLFTILLPLAVGALARRVAASLADRIQPLVATIGAALLAVAAIAILIAKWPAVAGQARDGAVLAFAAFVLVGLIVGHALGGPDRDDRTVLALATSARHPGIAIAIATANFPGEQGFAPAALLYLITSAILSIPYVVWRKRSAGDTPVASSSE